MNWAIARLNGTGEETGLKLTFVLVHGSMHDGSCWDGVITELNRQGHVAYAPTLAGHGEEAGNFFTRTDCVESVVDYILERDIRDFILAGHSFAGIVIPGVAEQVSDRINRVVFQNAMVMEDGEAIYDVIPPVHQQMFDAVIKRDGERANWILPFDVFRERFINDADLEMAKKVYSRLRPICAYSQQEKIPMRGFQRLQVPTSYINFTDDIVLPHGEYAWYPRMADRLGLCRVVQKPGSHEVCYTNPELLAEALVEAGRP